MRPRILYSSFDVVPSPKGASTHILSFARALSREYDVDLVTIDAEGRAPEEDLGGVRCIRVPVGSGNLIERVEAFRRGVMKRVGEGGYRVAHFRSIWSGFPLAQLKGKEGLTLVYEANGFPSLELPHHYPFLARQKTLLEKFRMQEVATLVAADRVVTPSAVTAGYVQGLGIHRNKVTVVPNGVDPGLFRSRPMPVAEVPNLVYVGTLAPWQGLGVLFPALKKVSRVRPIRLSVLASGKKAWVRHYVDLARRVRIHRMVDFCPPRAHEDVPEAIAAGVLGLAPLTRDRRNTVQGCCPIKIVEYMACGRPVVASDLPVVRELVTHEREGLLVRPESVNALADAILLLLNDASLAERLARAAVERARELTWERANERLLDVYRELLG